MISNNKRGCKKVSQKGWGKFKSKGTGKIDTLYLLKMCQFYPSLLTYSFIESFKVKLSKNKLTISPKSKKRI